MNNEFVTGLYNEVNNWVRDCLFDFHKLRIVRKDLRITMPTILLEWYAIGSARADGYILTFDKNIQIQGIEVNSSSHYAMEVVLWYKNACMWPITDGRYVRRLEFNSESYPNGTVIFSLSKAIEENVIRK